MHIEHIFTSFVAMDHLHLDHSAIAKFCYNKIKNDPGTLENQCMVGYEESQQDFFKPLIDTVYERFQFLHSRFDFDPTVRQEIINVWINLNANSITGAPHSHPTATFSAVYWPQCSEGSGALEFMTPIVANRYTFPDGIRTKMNPFNSDMWSIKPQVGRIVFFPSWLTHFVRPNTDGKDRISIAFNSLFENRVGFR
jgi:uncharacterized protein (TIGR02466 family)